MQLLVIPQVSKPQLLLPLDGVPISGRGVLYRAAMGCAVQVGTFVIDWIRNEIMVK